MRTYVFFFFSFFRDTLFLHCDSKPCTYEVVIIVLSPISTCVVSFHFLCTCFLYILYAIFYFCFTLRCRDEFCLKCFRNTGCQSLLAMNSLFAKFFKSMSWVIYDFSHMFICLLRFCHRLPKGRLLGYMWFMLGTYVMQITLRRTKSFYWFPFPIWIRIYLL